MNRHIKKIEEELFNLLVTHTEINPAEYPKAHIFVTKEEFATLQTDVISLVTFKFCQEQTASIYELDGTKYLILPGEYNSIILDSLTAIEERKEITYVYIVDNNINALDNANEDELLEYVFIDKTTKDIDWDVVRRFFPSFSLFKIEDALPRTKEGLELYLKRICLAAVCQTPSMHMLPFSKEVISGYEAIANSDNDDIPYDNILHSILSYQWKFCFIDLYRCQENLLLWAWVDNFKKTMKSTLELANLYSSMKNTYPTEHHEKENMISLYSLLPEDILSKMTKGTTSKEKSKKIYELRNKIVHYQKSDKEVESKKESEWNMIVDFLLKSIPALYKSLESHIKEIPDIH